VVYFIQAGGDDGPVKIGWSLNPMKRLRSLQTGSGQVLRLLAVMPGDRKKERAMHRAFSSRRIHGEWFNPGFALWGTIWSLRRG